MSDIITELNTEPTTIVEDLKSSKDKTPFKANEKTIGAQAATSALLAGGDLISTYNTVGSEIAFGGSSDTAGSIYKDSLAYDKEQNKQAAISVASDPVVSIEVKEMVLRDLDKEVPNSRDLLSQNFLYAGDEDEKATKESNSVRDRIIEDLKATNNNLAAIERMVHLTEMRRSNHWTRTVAEMAEIVIPFVDQKFRASVISDLKKEDGGDKMPSLLKTMALMGSSTANVRDWFKKLPSEKQLEFTSKLIDLLENDSKIVTPEPNNLAAINFLKAVVEDGYYGDGSEFLDNVASTLDMVFGVGAAFKATVNGIRVAKAKVAGGAIKPTSILQNAMNNNSEAAKALSKVIDVSEGDEVSIALTGVGKNESTVYKLGPKPNLNGTLETATGNIEILPDIRLTTDVGSVNKLTEGEAAQALEKLEDTFDNAFKNALEPKMYKERVMVKHNIETGNADVTAVYSPHKGTYNNPQDALDIVAFSLRDYGVDHRHLTLMGRKFGTNEYVPTTINELRFKSEIRDGFRKKKQRIPDKYKTVDDYVVGVQYEYKYDLADVAKTEKIRIGNFALFGLDTHIPRTFLQAMPARAKHTGTLEKHTFDPGSLYPSWLNKRISNAVDQASGLGGRYRKHALELQKILGKIPQKRQNLIERFLKEANKLNKEISWTEIRSKWGFEKDEMEALRNYRVVQDSIFAHENMDFIRSLRRKGYQWVVAGGKKVLGRPIARNKVTSTLPHNRSTLFVYHPEDGKFSQMKKREYLDFEGDIVKLREPVEMKYGNNKTRLVEYAAVANNEKSYLRRITDNDTALNYKPWYYHTTYKDQWFIIKEFTEDGVTIRRAVANSGNHKDADLIARRLQSVEQDPNITYSFRRDLKDAVSKDFNWDLKMSRNRSSHMHKGDRLGQFGPSDPTNFVDANIDGPFKALTDSMNSIAQRVHVREAISDMKTRFLDTYAEVLPRDKNTNAIIFPSSINEIKSKTGLINSDVLDAKSMYEYIRFLEEGYINTIDETWKHIMRTASDLGEKFTEKELSEVWDWLHGPGAMRVASKGALALSKKAPTHVAKTTAFQAYLALNPLRQAFIQEHQTMMLLSKHFKWMTTKMFPQITALFIGLRNHSVPDSLLKVSGWTFEEFETILNAYRRGGFYHAVDNHSYMRQDILDLADASIALTTGARAWNVAKRTLHLSQKIGFNMGEQINMATSFLAHVDEAKKAGHLFNDVRVQDDVLFKARNFTYNMNRAGDMAYQHNWLNWKMQFFQVPHKAFLQLTNTTLTGAEKAKLAATHMFMFGAYGTVMYEGVIEPVLDRIGFKDDPDAKEIVKYGIEAYLFNQAASMLAGKKVRTDYTALGPLNLHDLVGTNVDFFDLDLTKFIKNSPIGQLTIGENARIPRALTTVFNVMGLGETSDVDVGMKNVFQDIISISSGGNSYFQTMMNYRTQKWWDKKGKNYYQEGVSKTEAVLNLFGFHPVGIRNYWEATMALSKDKKAFRSTLEHILNTWSSRMLQNGEDPTQASIINKGHALMMEQLRDADPSGDFIRGVVKNWFRTSLKNPKHELPRLMARLYGDGQIDRLEQLIMKNASTPEQIKEAKTLVKSLRIAGESAEDEK